MPSKLLLILIIITFCSCRPVNELTKWHEKEFMIIYAKSTKILIDKTLKKPFPDAGIYKGIGKRLLTKENNNQNEIRHIRWLNGNYFYDVFFYQSNNEKWYVLDAAKWRKNVKF